MKSKRDAPYSGSNGRAVCQTRDFMKRMAATPDSIWPHWPFALGFREQKWNFIDRIFIQSSFIFVAFAAGANPAPFLTLAEETCGLSFFQSDTRLLYTSQLGVGRGTKRHLYSSVDHWRMPPSVSAQLPSSRDAAHPPHNTLAGPVLAQLASPTDWVTRSPGAAMTTHRKWACSLCLALRCDLLPFACFMSQMWEARGSTIYKRLAPGRPLQIVEVAITVTHILSRNGRKKPACRPPGAAPSFFVCGANGAGPSVAYGHAIAAGLV